MNIIILPSSFFAILLVYNLNDNTSPTTTLPTLDNCVPEQGVSRHLCPDCKDILDAAKFSKGRESMTGVNTVFQQDRIGDWMLVGKDMNPDTNIPMSSKAYELAK